MDFKKIQITNQHQLRALLEKITLVKINNDYERIEWVNIMNDDIHNIKLEVKISNWHQTFHAYGDSAEIVDNMLILSYCSNHKRNDCYGKGYIGFRALETIEKVS